MEYNTILGYQYLTDQEAQNAIDLCNQHYGIPLSPEDVTTTITTYSFSYGNPEFFYIKWFDLLTPVLGEPTSFDIMYYPLSGSTSN